MQQPTGPLPRLHGNDEHFAPIPSAPPAYCPARPLGNAEPGPLAPVSRSGKECCFGLSAAAGNGTEPVATVSVR